MTNQPELLILGIGVSPFKNDGVRRFEHFCNIFGLDYKIIGDGKTWHGGDMFAGTGGGQKINELLCAIENMENKLIIVCDTFDLFPLAREKEILEKFNKLCNPDNILFSSEVYCWPDKSLAQSYTKSNSKYLFLNSGCIMGYRDDIYQLIKNSVVNDNDDDQLFFTLKYLSGKKIILDNKCELFQALNGCQDDIVIHKNRIYNKYTNSYPIFVHGNGPAKIFLNHIENYLETRPMHNYTYTIDSVYKLTIEPKVFFALYVDSSNQKDFNTFMDSVTNIIYQNKLVYVYDKNDGNAINELVNTNNYVYKPNTTSYVFNDFINSGCEYYFLLEQRCNITKTDILHELIPKCNNYHRIISPLLNNKSTLFYSNFWGALDNNGYYCRSDDYIDLVLRHKRGLWNVPFVFGAILFHKDIILNWDIMCSNKYADVDMQLCHNLRHNTLFMYMANFNIYGYISQN